MKVVIESPYAGDIDKNLNYARACMKDSLNRGEYPLASHLLYTQMLDDRIKEERELGMRAGLVWALKSDKAVFYADLGYSKGMLEAKKYYKKHNIDIEERFLWKSL